MRFMLAERRRSLLGWTLGAVAMILVMAAVYPSIRDTGAELEAYIESLPEGLMEAFGLGGASLTSPEGYLTSQLYSNLYPIILLIMGIGAASWTIAGAERDGTLEVTLAAPVSRIAVALQRFLAVGVLTFAVTMLSTAALAVISAPLGLTDDLPWWGVWSAGLTMWALVLLYSAVAFAVGAATGRSGWAIAAASVAAVVGFLGQVLAALAEPLQWMRSTSPWYWFLEPNPLVSPPSWLSLGLPLMLTAALVTFGVWAFDRRDLAMA
jgi:ABC-2 type transport system permease protein